MRLPTGSTAAAALALLLSGTSTARAQSTTLGSADFTFVLSRIDASSSALEPLDSNAAATFFSAARCACPTNFGVALALASGSVSKLASGDTLDATVMIGNDCDDVAAAPCTAVGTDMTLNATQTSSSETLPTSAVFSALAPGASCTALPSTSSRLWAIVRLDGARLTTQPASLPITLGGSGPAAPTAVATQTADSGLLVTWTGVTDAATTQGYQVLCSPGPGSPPAAAFDTCAAAPSSGGTGPFASLDPSLICSGLIGADTKSARVKNLTNGSAYQVAVVAIGNDGTPSAPSATADGTPNPTLGFDDIYKEEGGGTATGGCALAGPRRAGGAAGCGVTGGLAMAIATALAARRRGRRTRGRGRGRVRALSLALGLSLSLSLLLARAARAADDGDRNSDARGGQGEDDSDDLGLSILSAAPPGVKMSPRRWNMELRFGPYYPNVDSELADRGQTARPFEETFSSAKRLMMGLEMDRHLSHRGGTWAVGFGAGYYRASASALAEDHVTRTGDQTALRIIPLSLSAVYRADLLRRRYSSPVVPYAKAGLDCALWTISDTAKSGSTGGQTLGWHAAAGVSLDLSFLDPDGLRTMDAETGVNQIAVFLEGAHYALDGFGASSVLHLGDTTWLGGLMLEM